MGGGGGDGSSIEDFNAQDSAGWEVGGMEMKLMHTGFIIPYTT